MSRYDTIVIGGGFYGLRIAQFLAEELKQKKILVIEKEPEVMSRASSNNQARVHNGYHYPRSVLTGLRSRVNLPVFSKEYEPAIVSDFETYYAIAKQFSKVSANQFLRFCEHIKAEISPAPEAMHFFNERLIEQVFRVKEYAFSAAALKNIMMSNISSLNIDIRTGEVAGKLTEGKDCLELVTSKGSYQARHVLNVSYAGINQLNQASGLPLLPLKNELAEICLVKIPAEFKNKAFTVMCGPFFSLMPFPDKQLYSLSHVRYTPHLEWRDRAGLKDKVPHAKNRPSHFPLMHADIKRYMPLATKIEPSGQSLWEIKTILSDSENDDSRPILYRVNHGNLRNYICIMGGKIDNIYDVFKELRVSYGKAS